MAATPRAAALAAAGGLLLAAELALLGCAAPAWFDPDPPPLRIDRAVEDAADPVERGGERGVPGSTQLIDRMR